MACYKLATLMQHQTASLSNTPVASATLTLILILKHHQMQAEAAALEELKEVKVSARSFTKPGEEVKKKGRKISTKCWMATKFPMSLRQLLPVMDVIGHANKHLARVSKFLNKYGDMDLFPVKFQVRAESNRHSRLKCSLQSSMVHGIKG